MKDWITKGTPFDLNLSEQWVIPYGRPSSQPWVYPGCAIRSLIVHPSHPSAHRSHTPLRIIAVFNGPGLSLTVLGSL